MSEAKHEVLRSVADDDYLLELARKAIEDVLVSWRDDRISELRRNNGLVIKEVDGSPSNTIRFGPETAMRIGLKAIADHLAKATGQ
jgi:ketopantoate reductase